MSEKDLQDFENIPGTWAYVLKKHWDAFNHACWGAFNAACEEMAANNDMERVSKYKWREYVLWDMQRRHDEEKGEA